MTRRDHAVVAVLVLLLAVLGGAIALPPPAPSSTDTQQTPGPSPIEPVTYREGVIGVPESITPLTAHSRSERTIVGLVFSGLVRLGAGNRLEPDLAASWTTDDTGRIWTFRIRDDAVWQDGVPVTSADVVYTVGALKSPDAAGPAAASWAEVDVAAVDDKTVQFTLASPIASFLAAATTPLLPAHLLADVPYADLATSSFARQPVGTGPYALSSLDETSAVLTPAALLDTPASGEPSASVDSLATPAPAATPARPVPYLERIEIHFYPDAPSLAAALAAGEIDAAAGLPPIQAESLASVTGLTTVRYPTTTLAAVMLNLRPTHPELQNAKVRQALLAAIDRNQLVTTVYGGDAARADALVPPDSWAFDATAAPPVAFDTKKAATLLTGAGWKKTNGAWVAPATKVPYKLEIISVPAEANSTLAAAAAYVRDAWTALGFQVDLVTVPTDELASRLRAGTFTAAVVDIAMGLEPDLYPLLASTQVRSTGSNLSGYQDPTLDPLLEAARTPAAPDVRLAQWKTLLAALADRQPILPLAWKDEVVLERGVEGMTPRLISGPGDQFWDVLAWRLAADR